MSHTIHVKPAADLKVFDPATKDFLPEEGRAVSASLYWARRILDGDAIETRWTAAKAPAAKPAKANK